MTEDDCLDDDEDEYAPSPHDDEHEARIKRVMRAARADRSGFTAVLIGNAYIEYYLRKILETKLPNAAAFLRNEKGEDMHYDYMVLLKLVSAVNALPPENYKVFKAFANLRNVFAHSPDADLDEQKLLLRKLFIAMGDNALDVFDRQPALGFELLLITVRHLAWTVQHHQEKVQFEKDAEEIQEMFGDLLRRGKLTKEQYADLMLGRR